MVGRSYGLAWDYNYSSTMNKKPIEKLTNHSSYNQELFSLARAIVQNCNQLLNKTQPLPQEEKAALKDKQHQLENAIRSAITLFGKFVSIPKPPLATVADHGSNIFESITDNIETSVQRYKEAHRNGKGREREGREVQGKRPQDLYPFIKPAAFDMHTHEKNLEFMRTELQVVRSREIAEPYTYVSTPLQLEEMIGELSKESAIAVDVEHSNKSYQGLTCLLQFSSRHHDYIVDVFPLWREMGQLRRVLEDWSIIKVMHGADMDSKWLQRDFNLHILNLFDTYRASRVLGFARHSYAYLLHHYCSVATDKAYQLADWTQRPLPAPMLHYARLDTHYLLEIFDRLLADLHQKALSLGADPTEVIAGVYASSFEVTRNEAMLFDFREKEFYVRLRRETREEEFEVFEKVFGVVDLVAREEDVAFDQLCNLKLERQLVAKIKELLYLRTSDHTKIKIDKFLAVLKDSPHGSLFQNHLSQLKDELEAFFATYRPEDRPERKPKKNKIAHLEEYHPTTEESSHRRTTFTSHFQEYPLKTYECLHLNPFSILLFEPIMAFLSKKTGVVEKEDTREEALVESSEEQVEGEGEGEVEGEGEAVGDGEGEGTGVIEFKRINPNVVYTVEEAEKVEERHKPRKKRKELDYEAKLRSKEANIFELLED